MSGLEGVLPAFMDKEYSLNEKQAILLTMLAETERAKAVRAEIVDSRWQIKNFQRL
jgi:hypothetical protein